MQENIYYVYIISNELVTTLYTGVTNNLERRIYEHKSGLNEGFCKKYHLTILLYFEETDDVIVAIAREKKLKKWRRKWKLDLIKSENTDMKDLAEDWYNY